MDFNRELSSKVKAIDAVIARYLPKEEGLQSAVAQAANYSVRVGGKRLRPLLMAETCALLGGCDKAQLEPFMAAIEMIHTYSLIHDDLPCMDNDEYRRGKKTTWVVYGEAMALLAGDALLNYAYETASKALLSADHEDTLRRASRAMAVLASKPGISGMIGGQTVDVAMSGSAVSEDVLYFIYKMKTSALIECAMTIGAVLAGADNEMISQIESIATYTGLAFQIQDDILDVTSSLEVLGKQTRSDEKNNKTTYVTLFGLDAARAEVERLSKEAVALLYGAGGRGSFLEALLKYLIYREK